MRKQGETQSQTDYATSQLRNQIENRLSELRDVVVELRAKQDKESQDRRMLEQQLALRSEYIQPVHNVVTIFINLKCIYNRPVSPYLFIKIAGLVTDGSMIIYKATIRA